jgi:protease IV
MEHGTKRSRSESFFYIIKNLFIILLFLQFAPMILLGLKSSIEEALFPKVHVGYLSLNGPISESNYYIKKIDEFSRNSEIKALLLRINSPGGYSGSCQAIFNELKKFKTKKPIVALIEDMGASGGYYVAMTANTVIASPMSLVGSIGVFMELPNVKDLLSSWKIQYRYIQSGTYKTAGSMTKDVTSDEIAYLQTISDDQYKQFISDVAECRKLVVEDHKKWADGKAFTGNQALKLKLIDKLGSYSDAIAEIKKLLKTDEELKLIQPKRPSNFARLFGGDEDYGQDSISMSDHVAGFLSDVCDKFSAKQTQKAPQLA